MKKRLFLKRVIAAFCMMSLIAGSMAMRGDVMKVQAADADVVVVDINGESVESAANNVNGLTYKGFGVLNANSTSNLLIDYKYQNPAVYRELLQILFGGEHPIMTHIKMEMGNDGNNSTGADSCTKRYEDEEADVSRSPGFILAADAKKINPDIKVSILRWQMPRWVEDYWNSDRKGAGYEAVYTWYKETILDAYEKYGYILDYINPDANETQNPDDDFIKWFRERLNSDDEFPSYMDENAIKAYHSIKIIASDEYLSFKIVANMLKDEQLFDSVDAIGSHYNTGERSNIDCANMADIEDKEVWYSEGCGNFSFTEYQKKKTDAYGAGTMGGFQSPLAMIDCMIKSAVYSRMTHYVFQPAIGSFYEGSQFDHKELLSAREPWAGTVHYDEALYCLSHISKFAKLGWENESNTKGIWRYIADASNNTSSGTEHLSNENGNPSYMTLASPDKKDFSTIIVNNSNKSLTYKIETFGMDIDDSKELELWETKTDSYFQYKGNIKHADDGYIVNVEPFSMVTVTTLNCNGKEEYTKRLPSDKPGMVLDTDATGSFIDTTDSNVLYADDYEYKNYPADYLEKRGNEPRYTVDSTGAFYVEDGRLIQKLDTEISQWRVNEPSAVVGDFRWMNYKAAVDIQIPDYGFAGIVIREQTGMNYRDSGYSLKINESGDWVFSKRRSELAKGSVDANDDGLYKLAITGKGNVITAEINGEKVYEYTDSNAELFGRVRFFSGWNEAYYDNLLVTKLEGGDTLDTIPYGGNIIDNSDENVDYEGNWTITSARGSSDDWYRTTSKSSTVGASFTFDVNTDAFALIGENTSGSVEVYDNGELVEADGIINQSNKHGSFLVIDGLGKGDHNIKVVLKSGSITLDAIMPIGELPTHVIKSDLSGNWEAVDKNQNPQPIVTPAPVTPVVQQPSGTTSTTVENTPKPVKTKLAKVKLKSAKRVKGKVKITWKRNSKADGYVLERSVGNKKKFKAIKTIKKNKTVSYIDKKASAKKMCYYRIRAYKKNGNKKTYSKYSNVIKVKPTK
ncbi:MAG: GH59 galactosidase [Lachnospiraceae bacterium]|nr:GH59 galactosidase [Lachnospiraceae bacterium]